MKVADVQRNAMCAALVSAIDAGTPPGRLEIRTGSAPTNTTDADSGTLLATLLFSATAFAAPGAGIAVANAISPDTDVDSNGLAGHFRIKNAAGVVIMQGSVGTGSGDINFNSVNFVQHGTCAIVSLTATVPAGS